MRIKENANMGVETSYVSNNGQFYADTVEDYNNYDDTTNCDHFGVCSGNSDIGINVGGDTYLPLDFPIFMYEYGWATFTSGGGPAHSSGYYVGILDEYANESDDITEYFLATNYTTNPSSQNLYYYNYYYSGTGWYSSQNSGSGEDTDRSPPLYYYFVEDNTGHISGYNGGTPLPFVPPDQQDNPQYSQYGVFWLYNWFILGNMFNIYFLMNGNIFNYSLASVPYTVDGQQVYAIPPNPPANTINGEPIFAQSYINAYNTAFNQPYNQQNALYKYQPFTYGDVNNNNFIPGTFGYEGQYNSQSGASFTIYPLQDNASVYVGTPYLFISAGSGGGSGYMYLDWVIVTYGVPYVASVS